MVALAGAEQDERPWAIYARLSKAQDGGLEKTEHQVQQCRDYAEARGIATDPQLEFVDDSLSAWKKRVRRPHWDELMVLAGSGVVGGILVFAVDRFTRRPKDLEALIELAEDHDLGIDGPRSGRLDLTTATGRQQARWMALQAATESDNTSERIKATLGRKMREGKPMGAGRAYGFEIGGTEQRTEEVAVIREVARRMLAREPVMAIARDLNERGLRTARGGQFMPGNLRQLMVRPRNGGHVEHRGQIVGTIPGEPILDAETYDELVAMVSARRRGRPHSGRYLLTGVAVCGRCGTTMTATTVSRGGRESRRRVYLCAKRPGRGGCARSIRAEETEAIVDHYMTELLTDPAAITGIATEAAKVGEARVALLAQVDAAELALAELEVKWAQGDIIKLAYERARPVLDKRLAKARAALEDVGRPQTSPVLLDAQAEWSHYTDDEKRATIANFGVTITIEAQSGKGGYFQPERVHITRPGGGPS
jgi:site-specific DNA recombinase